MAEQAMWQALRGSRFKGLKFRRQVPIGNYVADFLCVEHSLIVELDGRPHEDPGQQAHDRNRDAFLRAKGYAVLRFPNDLILGGCDLALEQIESAIAGANDPARPSPAEAGEGGRRSLTDEGV